MHQTAATVGQGWRHALIYGTALLLAAGTGGLAAQGSALAQAPAAQVELSSTALVERTETDANGQQKLVLTEPGTVLPGDRIRFTLTYRNGTAEPVADFVVDNPLPAAIALDSVAEDWAQVSVDGGLNYGQLADLTVTETPEGSTASVTRAATSADVTHLRWRFATPIPAGATGTLGFTGVVK